MRSKAAIGSHPIHPMLIPIPIGAFALAFIGDLAFASTREEFWYRFAFNCLLIGIISALVAAVAGFIDYVGVRMSHAGKRLAGIHMGLNLGIVAVYAVSLYLRWGGFDANREIWSLAMALEIISFVALGASGWIGGKVSYEHKVGVNETLDREATEIGIQDEGVRS